MLWECPTGARRGREVERRPEIVGACRGGPRRATPATVPRGHQRSAAPFGRIAIVRVAATGSAAVVDALFGAGGLAQARRRS